MPICRAASLMEPVSSINSSTWALPGPMVQAMIRNRGFSVGVAKRERSVRRFVFFLSHSHGEEGAVTSLQ